MDQRPDDTGERRVGLIIELTWGIDEQAFLIVLTSDGRVEAMVIES